MENDSAVPDQHPGTITRAVNLIASGSIPPSDQPGVDRVYATLREIASAQVARNPGALLDPTELVHEAFLKLFRPGSSLWQSRAHFYGSAARAMQQVLIDRWRVSGRLVQLDPAADPSAAGQPDPLALIDLLDRLGREDALLAEVVRLRVFAGLSVETTAELLGVSPRSVKRYFAFARTWLYLQLADRTGPPPNAGPRDK